MLSQVTDSLYVWRDPAPSRNGTPIDLAEAERLADFAVAEGIATIYYDNFGCGTTVTPDCPQSAGVQDSSTLAPIIALLHGHGVEVEALYTDNTRINDVVNYNNTAPADALFDGIRLDIEAFPSGGSEPTTPSDIDVYAQAVAMAGALPVYVSISHHWDDSITYNTQTKPAYKHILDIVAGVDVQTAQDGPTVIENISKEEVCYANSLGKPVHVTIETYDVVTHLGLNPFNTFFEEGEAGMKSALATLDYAGVTDPCSNPSPTGFAYHFYRQSFGSPDLPGWQDDVPAATLSIGDLSVQEGGSGSTTLAVFTVTLSASSDSVVTVAYATLNGTATVAEGDYDATSGTLTFNPGETSWTIAVTVNGDKIKEPDETFVVSLTGASGATIADAQGVGTILDDDKKGGGVGGGGKGGGGGGKGGRRKSTASSSVLVASANSSETDLLVLQSAKDTDPFLVPCPKIQAWKMRR